MRATYSPEDNKLRLYSDERLDEATYARVKAKGFRWAPKQELFVAPMWTPGREALLIELCGDIGDEDTTLAERAEERAERYEDISEKRADEAHRTYDVVADAVQNGSITVGHHSAARAEKEAKRIENLGKKAVALWDESGYWTRRAKGALRHAKYKEDAGVRHRRIKGIEADKRKVEKEMKESFKFLTYWGRPDLTHAMARQIANYDHQSYCFTLEKYPRELPVSQYEGPMGLWSALDGIITMEQARKLAITTHERNIAKRQKWHQHYENRLAYERAMLDEQGGVVSDHHDIKVGGKVLVSGAWLVVLRVNKSLGSVSSLTTQAPAGHWCKNLKVNIESVSGYEEPTAEVTAAAKAATKLPPMCNYPGEGFREMTSAEYSAKHSEGKQTMKVKATDTVGAYRYRIVFDDHFKRVRVFLTDAKRVDPPALTAAVALPLPEPEQMARRQYVPQEVETTKFADLQDALKGGVQVVTANQLFPTPNELAKRMADILDIQVGHRVLEPSAGTGRLLGAIGGKMFGSDVNNEQIVAVEINPTLARKLVTEFPLTSVRCKDFLECKGDLGLFDRILMNPPFENASDIKHIKHALGFLKPGGTMVAICANGPRQDRELRPLADEWEDLPPGTFASEGTGVNTALLTFYG